MMIDAQSTCNKFHDFCKTSIGARVNASNMLSYITSAKFKSWKGATESFMLHWQDQTRLHESIVDSGSYFSENQKKTLLENAVDCVKHCVLLKIKPIICSPTQGNNALR